MTKTLSVLACSALMFAGSGTTMAQKKADSVRIALDLSNVVNDMVKVTIYPPQIKENSIVYILPATIPGTYAKKDFVRFMENVQAFDKKGDIINIERESDQQIRIPNAKNLSKIEYWMHDSWDDADSAKYIFPPGGTNIQEGKNFMINHAGFYGYFDGYKMTPYSITVTKPAEMYGATSLSVNRISPTTDILKSPNYVHLVDNPVMYSAPDTVSFTQGNIRINIAAYSPKPTMNAKKLQGYIEPLTLAIKNFLGEMPVDNYTFLFYFLGEPGVVSQIKGFGALEHSYSSVYFLPLTPNENQIKELVNSSAVHEFLHILVPLNLHSEEIGDFNYRTPKMSQHLWLYEGVTEYFSHLALAQDGIHTEDKFMDNIREKIMNAEMMSPEPISLTKFSKNILDPEYGDIYPVIYEKGAVTALLLDIRLRELSDGKLTLLKLVNDLTKKYGPNKPFKDNELVDEIVKMTYPEIRQFFNDFVIGEKPLPFKEYFAKIGWNYQPEAVTQKLGFGSMQVHPKMENGKLAIELDPVEESSFGIKKGDMLLSINGEEITPMNGQRLFEMMMDPEPGREVELSVLRGSDTLKLSAVPSLRDKKEKHVIEKNPDIMPQQSKLKKQLIYRQS
ncbi:MAG TPA: peptidase M61 [Patescibacteria group bacterium]|nr:peptidase M61 [Patescibacteria group bacterium]